MNAELESFLKEMKKYVAPGKEITLFALGGRSYYENPASDLLAFFLKPDAEHKLGDLFLSTYFECMKENHRQFDTRGVKIEREMRTGKNNRIDLQIVGKEWCLLIENKINHWDANDFTDYEDHAKKLGKPTPLFSILSRDGHSKDNNGTRWVGVSYKDYCLALREKMPATYFDSPFSKWHIFAREFILHLENELYPPPMTQKQAAEVEKHADQIAEAEKLAWQYREFIRQELKRRLKQSVQGNEFDIREEWRDFCWLGFRCTSLQWNDNTNNKIYLFSPGTGGKFFIQVYLADLSEPHLSNATPALNLGPVNSGGFWKSREFDSREEAIAELCKLAQIVNGLLKK